MRSLKYIYATTFFSWNFTFEILLFSYEQQKHQRRVSLDLYPTEQQQHHQQQQQGTPYFDSTSVGTPGTSSVSLLNLFLILTKFIMSVCHSSKGVRESRKKVIFFSGPATKALPLTPLADCHSYSYSPPPP